MKTLFRISVAAAMLLTALLSCQKAEEITDAPVLGITHTVRFTTEMPTKTSYVVDGNSVKYRWEEADIENLKVFEDGTAGTIIGHSISENGVLSLEVSFESPEGPHTYTAYLNGAVKSEQVETGTGSYDPTCDVLVAKPVQSSELVGEGGSYTFSFRRPVAITELKLKGLTAGEKVSKVTVISDSEHPIAGKYTQSTTDDSTGEWSESSNKIVVSFGESKTVDGEGVLNLSIVTRPIKEASVKVLVETESGLKYRKVTASALTLLADVVKAQGIGLTQVTEAEHEEDGWYLVTDVNELFDGDEIRIACTSENMMAGDFAVDKDSKTQTYLANCAVSFDKGKLTGVTPGSEPQIFTLSEGYGKWNITTVNGKLGATAARSLKYNEGSLNWGISIGDEGVAKISSETDGYGEIKYNNTYPRFLNYASEQTDIQIFKKYGTPEDPVIKTARTASFSPEKTTVTIGAQDNVYPELSFNPAEATEGTRTWTSSNTEVATVNAATGDVTLVSDGTATITVLIAGTDTYQPCTASYVLTVKPAAVEGVDYLDRDWTGVTGTSYTDWNITGSSTGNTYSGNSAGSYNSIQLRSSEKSGIVVTTSTGNKVAKSVSVRWNTNTTTSHSIKVFGKESAYSSAADLHDKEEMGAELGTISYGGNQSVALDITDDFPYIGILAERGAVYLNSISIRWEDAPVLYDIDVTGTADGKGNGITVEDDKYKAKEGTEISLNVNLAPGYSLSSLKINEVEHSSEVSSRTYKFTMPAQNVTVSAEFSWNGGQGGEGDGPKGLLELPARQNVESYFYDSFGTGQTRNYSYCYDKTRFASLWTAYPLTSSHTQGNGDKSKWNWNPHLDKSYQVNIVSYSYGKNYNDATYARGHMCPNADRKCDAEMNSQTYYATNQLPQIQNGFNSGIWSSLEGAVRDLLTSTDTVYVAVGPCYKTTSGNETVKQLTAADANIKPDNVDIPNYFYKVLLKVQWNGNQISSACAIGFWLEHKVYGKDENDYTKYAVSVDEIEEKTGIDFFANLPDTLESSAEQNADWNAFSRFPAGN